MKSSQNADLPAERAEHEREAAATARSLLDGGATHAQHALERVVLACEPLRVRVVRVGWYAWVRDHCRLEVKAPVAEVPVSVVERLRSVRANAYLPSTR